MPQLLTPIGEFDANAISLDDVEGELDAVTDTELEIRNTGDLIGFVANGSASPLSVTVESQPDPFGRGGAGDDDNDEPLVVAAGDIGFIPYLRPEAFNDGSGKAHITLDATTDITVGFARVR